MQSRQRLAALVLLEGMPVSEAARELGVSRPTASLWVQRAREEGIAGLSERSRRPLSMPRSTHAEAELALLELKARRPGWGAKKLVARLWPDGGPMCVRTADRILRRRGLVRRRGAPEEAAGRFERASCNELWQMDFKGAGASPAFAPLSVIDDRSRFCILLSPLASMQSAAVFEALWAAFGEFGLPDEVLADNGSPFNSVRSDGPTPLQAMLWLAGVRTLHGRPRHPQTQGKVERFHRTVQEEIGEALRLRDPLEAAREMAAFREGYNWERPHEAVGMRVPGAVYEPSARKRPARLPEHEIPEGAIARKVDASGKLSFRSRSIRVGHGLTGQRVEIREEEQGYAAYFAGVRIGALDELEV